jgi:hypothetical protein
VRFALSCTLMAVAIAVPAVAAPINLGSASSFGLIGGTISNTGTSVVNGNVGATTTITGFPPGTATGTVFAPGDPTATAAYNDFVLAFIQGSGLTPTQSVTDLTTDRTFLGNNVFDFPTLTDVTSTTGINLTFDAQFDSSQSFVIQIARDLTINGPLSFTLINGAQSTNIYWIVGRTQTISSGGGPVTFDGNILAGTSFTMSANPGGSGVLAGTINGCVFAETANTLAGTTQVGGCSAAAAVPEPGTSVLVALGLLGALGLIRLRSMLVPAVIPSVK